MLALAGSALIACGSSQDNGTPASQDLSGSETESLMFTREEEKLARDVYSILEGMDGAFSNIKQSEQTHMDAVLTLLSRHGARDPADAMAVGQFENVMLQRLYGDLVAHGRSSTLSALEVGAAIEELDIRDFEVAKKSVSHGDILTTYDNLTRGSRNHLRTFHSKLKALGGSYTPQYLDAGTFQSIVESPMEAGGPGR